MSNNSDSNLEQELSRLIPKPVMLDRDALIFQAGVAAGRRNVLPWRVGSGVLATISACLLATMLHHPAPVTRPPANTSSYAAIAPSEPETPSDGWGLCLSLQLRKAMESDETNLLEHLPLPNGTTRMEEPRDNQFLTKELKGDSL